MSELKNKVSRFYERVWNQADKSLIPELLHENVTFRGSLGHMQSGHTGFSNYIDFVRNALDDYRCCVVDMVAEEDRLYARIEYSGTHRGELFGYAPTYAKLHWDGIAVFTFENGKISNIWVLGDVNGVMKQLARYVME